MNDQQAELFPTNSLGLSPVAMPRNRSRLRTREKIIEVLTAKLGRVPTDAQVDYVLMQPFGGGAR
jgi:hypothetical protein